MDVHQCRICGSREFHYRLRNFSAEDRTWNLLTCNTCGFGTTSPLPDQATLSSMYSKEYWGSASDKLVDAFYCLRMGSFAGRIRKHSHRGARALDVGAGNGAWAKLLTKYGFDAAGIDPYASESSLGIVYKASLEDAPFPPQTFDLITFMNVLEHLNDPVDNIRKASRLLRTGGLLVIEVPNLNSFGFRQFKENWYPIQIPWHLNHFTPSSLHATINKAGGFNLLYSSGFSLRDCPSSLANSMIPGLAPSSVRKRFKGVYPFPLKLAYLFIQAICLPVSAVAAQAGSGEFIRVIYKKL